jgi:hypothetical protein
MYVLPTDITGHIISISTPVESNLGAIILSNRDPMLALMYVCNQVGCVPVRFFSADFFG